MTLILNLLLQRYIFKRKNKPSVLFSEALRKENNGHFLVARMTYETALNEINKSGFGGSSLKNKIVEKLKVLDTVIEYKNSFYVR